jgi:hypothetical protein
VVEEEGVEEDKVVDEEEIDCCIGSSFLLVLMLNPRHSHVSKVLSYFTCSCSEGMIGRSLLILCLTSFHTNKTQTKGNTNSTSKSIICDRVTVIYFSVGVGLGNVKR